MRIAARYVVAVALAFGIASAGMTRSAAADRAARRAQQAAEPPGQTVTRLADGRWLIAGGEIGGKASATGRIVDPSSGAAKDVALPAPRAWHTATVLPDGTVLIAGGNGSGGQLAGVPEILDPATLTVTPFAMTGAALRTGASATLLTDGRVLVAGGGGGDGQPLRAEVWDLKQGTATPIGDARSRSRHAATLLPDGRVQLSGGQNAAGRALRDAEVIDPVTGQTTAAPMPPAIDMSIPVLAGSVPEDAATDVAVDTRLALRFSKALAIATIRDAITLSGPDGPVGMAVVPTEGGRLVFVTAGAPLAPETTYALSIEGATDERGVPLATATISFTTKAGDKQSTPVDTEAEGWLPDAAGGWRTNRPDTPWRKLEPLMAPPGTTAISGQVLRLNGKPLADVTLEVDGHETRTDRTGRFLLLLPGAGDGRRELEIDGRSANRPQRTYGTFEYGLAVKGGQTTVLPFIIWMPLLDTAHQVTIASPTTGENVITTPYIPGLELHLPAGTVIKDDDGQIVRTVSITPIPVDRTPFPLATNVDVPIYFTIQPGGAYVSTPPAGPGQYASGAWLVYPNYRHEYVGKRIQFFHYDPRIGWYVYGLGTVMAGGAQVMPDPKTRIHEFTGAMINGGGSPPPDGPPPGDNCGDDSDPVNLVTGLFSLKQSDVLLPDVLPVALTRIYRTRDLEMRPFGVGATHPYAMFLFSAHQYTEADLIMPDGGRVHYIRTSAGVSFTDAVFEHVERPNPPPGEVATSATPTAFYHSVMRWNGNGWDLTLKNGMVYVFGENAPLQAIRDRYGNTITITHQTGQMGPVTRVTSPHGRWIEFTYTLGLITQVKDNIGRTWTYTYDNANNLWKVSDPLNGVTEYTYDADHRMKTVKNRNGIVYVTNDYTTSADAPTPVGWVKKQTFADGGTFEFTYNVTNDRSTQTDVKNPRDFVRRVTFNTDGYTLSDVRAIGTQDALSKTYSRPDRTNFPASLLDSEGNTTSFGYDDDRHLRSVTNLFGSAHPVTTSYTYDARFGDVASVTDPLTHTTTFTYGDRGEMLSVTDPLNKTTSFTYNAAAQMTSVTDPLQHQSTITYTGADATSEQGPLGFTSKRFVDGVGRTLTRTDAVNRTTRYEYDAGDRITRIVDPAGQETLFTYFPDGQIHTATDPRGGVTTYEYDNMGRLASRTDPLTRTETFGYDKNGNLTTHVDRMGRTMIRSYDGIDRLKVITYADSSTMTYTYDDGGRPASIADSTGSTITRSWDDLSRLLTETTADGQITYTYDDAGRRATATVFGQTPVTYEYDNADRPTLISQGSLSATLTYDDAGRRSTLTLPSGVVVEYAYDDGNRLTGLTYRLGQTTLGTLTYSYDPTGLRTETGGTWARTLLPNASTAVYDLAGHVNTWNGVPFSYDDNGNLVSDGTNVLTWNTRDQLASLSSDNGSEIYAYDPIGRRAQVTAGAAVTRYQYDNDDIVRLLPAGQSGVDRLLGTQVDEWFAAGNAVPLADALNSTLAVTDLSAGMTSQYSYEPFGRTAAFGTGSTPFRYTGREPALGSLYYYRARYYSPGTGRFVSEDPAVASGYAYVSDSPLSFIDPTGMMEVVNRITEDIVDQKNIPGTAVAKTSMSSYWLYCDCKCDGNGCKLQGTFFMYGTMLLPKKVERVPKYDSTVKDTASARKHEYSWHIDPALAEVRKLVEPAEKKPYKSKDECQAACDALVPKAKQKFGDTLSRTQLQENLGWKRQ